MTPKTENFEQTMRELETIVARLEAGGLELDESLKLFEKGTSLFARCNRMLDSAQTKLDVLFEEAGQWQSRPVGDALPAFEPPDDAPDDERDEDDR